MNLWVFTSRFPYPIEKGDKLRLYFQLKELSRAFDITLFTLAEEKPDDEHVEELLKYCKDLHYVQLRKSNQIVNTFLSFAQQLPFQIGYFKNAALARIIKEQLDRHPPDAIYCHLIRMSEYVRAIPVPKVLDYMDAFSLGMYRASENSRNPFWRFFYFMESRLCAYYERYIFKYFDGWTIISQQDREALEILRNDRVTVVQNGIDLQQFFFESQLPFKKQIVFIGNLGYAPNVRAVDYLVNQLMPKLWQEDPAIKLMIAGARPANWMSQIKDDRVILKGWVEDIREAYAEGSVFVAPLFTGSGMQNKILEAMAVGLPCVTTSIVNNSIHAQASEEIIIAENVDTFVNGILQLLNDKTQFEHIRRKGRKFIEKNYPWENATQPLVHLLKHLPKHSFQTHAK
jgi:sugar transferase (PEP-CTERM/EpsH1 system associated)